MKTRNGQGISEKRFQVIEKAEEEGLVHQSMHARQVTSLS
jgi:hypothetical protein